MKKFTVTANIDVEVEAEDAKTAAQAAYWLIQKQAAAPFRLLVWNDRETMAAGGYRYSSTAWTYSDTTTEIVPPKVELKVKAATEAPIPADMPVEATA